MKHNRRRCSGKPRVSPTVLDRINPNVAGIDCGSAEHFVAVPPDRDPTPIQSFKTYTTDLRRLADWVSACRVTSVAMEATGVYWIPIYEILEARGIEVLLVNARHLKNVPGRKSDVLDCQWLQELHTYGLLRGAFRPVDQVCILRSYLRQRSMLVTYASHHIQHMQKALEQMNLKLAHVVSDISGLTGMGIIKAILNGERDPAKLAKLRDPRCKNSEAIVARALEGHYREEHMFALRQAVELVEFYQHQITACDCQIEACLQDRAIQALECRIGGQHEERQVDVHKRHQYRRLAVKQVERFECADESRRAQRRRDPAAFDLACLAAAAEGFSGAEIEQAIVSALEVRLLVDAAGSDARPPTTTTTVAEPRTAGTWSGSCDDEATPPRRAASRFGVGVSRRRVRRSRPPAPRWRPSRRRGAARGGAAPCRRG